MPLKREIALTHTCGTRLIVIKQSSPYQQLRTHFSMYTKFLIFLNKKYTIGYCNKTTSLALSSLNDFRLKYS